MSIDMKARIEKLGQPKVGHILQLTRFLAKRLYGVSLQSSSAQDVVKRGFDVIIDLLNTISEDDILELARILAMDETITEDEVALGWMMEALAIWAERIDIQSVIKNAQRVAAAFKT